MKNTTIKDVEQFIRRASIDEILKVLDSINKALSSNNYDEVVTETKQVHLRIVTHTKE